jgi:menaquinone-dependent protoporphyrinogen oxidase
MTRVQVVYATRHGGSAGIAERIGEILRANGAEVLVVNAAGAPEASGYDAYVIGSGVYMGSWLKEGIAFLERNEQMLADKPVWLFSSGPLLGSSKATPGVDRLTDALGPEDGPGSGGRKKIEGLAAATHVRGHEVFLGAFDPNDPPKSFAERVVRLMPAAKQVLPTGDFRDWDAIEAWAHEIAEQLPAAVPVA